MTLTRRAVLLSIVLSIIGAIQVLADTPTMSNCYHPDIVVGKELIWFCSGGSEWYEVNDGDRTILRSGGIAAGETSYAEIVITGPGTLTFDWHISANRGDNCRFYIDSEAQRSITRSTSWATVTVSIPAGEHVARWSYERGSSAAANEDAAFLDNVDWRPNVSLSVTSEYGIPTPAAGTNTYAYGNSVAASVAEPAAVDGTRQVCTGWTGTGSVPATGVSNVIAFVINEGSSLTWNWRKEHFIEVSVSGGTCDFAPQWVADGSMVSVSIVPVTHLYSIAISGDTTNATLDGTTLSFTADGPKSIAVTVSEMMLPLTVESPHGVPSPTNGVHQVSWGTEVVASVAEQESVDGVQYVCTGWTGTGCVPSTGATNVVGFTMDEASSIMWNWRTNVWLSLSIGGPVYADFGAAWVERGGSWIAHFETMVPYAALKLIGDADGVSLDTENGTVTIPADRPRRITLAVEEITLPSVVEAPWLTWSTDGADTWFPQTAMSADGMDAAQSGAIIGDEVSGLETTLTGPGIFTWSWRIDSSGNSGVDVFLDGEWFDVYAPDEDWSRETLEIVGDGEHVIRFEYWNAGLGDDILDHAWIDQVSWTGLTAEGNVIADGVAIPAAWLDDNAAPFVVAANGNYTAAALAMASNGVNKVWECYVAGLAPTNSLSSFTAEIDFVEGAPVIRWSPDLRPERVYVVEGKALLSDDNWSVTNSASRFFRVRAFLPGGESSGGESGEGGSGGPSAASVTVTLDARGGTVSPTTLIYAAQGTLGALPVPQRLCWDFLGWYTGIESGLRLADTSPVPNVDATFYAHWRGAQYIIHYDANGGEGTMADQYANLDASVALSTNCFSNGRLLFGGWATTTNGVAIYPDGAIISNLTGNAGESVTLHAVWHDAQLGLAVHYYDISTSGYSSWTQSESAMIAYFAGRTPTIVTNTVDWGEGLDAGLPTGFPSEWQSAGLTMPQNACHFHGKYANRSTRGFAAILSGTLKVDESGLYSFAGVADDTVVLYIDGQAILANGESWGTMATGERNLSVGFHSISIAFREKDTDGEQGLSVQWKKPGDSSYTPIPQSALLHWTEFDTLRFHANGGTGEMADISVDRAFGAKLPPCAFSNDGMYFNGWATSENGPVVYTDGTGVPPNTIDLWAVWADSPPIPTGNLISSYSFSGSTSDDSGNGHTLGNNGGTFCADRFGNANSAIAFDGQGHNASGGSEVQRTFTVACWFQTSVTKTSAGSATGRYYPGNYLWYPEHKGSNAGVGIRIGTDGIEVVEHGEGYFPTKLSYSANIGTEWNHVCMVVENNTAVRLYLNGEKVSTGTLSTRTKFFALILGGQDWGYYTGKADDVFLFNCALTDSEVNSLYRLGL